MIRAAFRGEMRKIWKRPAAWVTFGLFAFITFIDLGEEFLDARKEGGDPFFLPDAWGLILGEEVMIGFVFASVLLILLVGAEFSWRTARQNVIDGLSKTQWYTAKLLLVPLLALLFLGSRAAFGGALAWSGTNPAGGQALLGHTQLYALAGMFLASLGYTSLALFMATAIRASGPAMAVWFAWFAFGERLLASGLGRLFESLRPALEWLPVSTFGRLTDYVQYDSQALRRAAEWAAAHDRPVPRVEALGPAVTGTALWIAGLALLGWLWFRRRDL